MSEQEVLIERVLGMDNNTFYTINDRSGLLTGFTLPLPGHIWKLLLIKEIKEYLTKTELSTLN